MLTVENAASELELLLTGEADCLSNGPCPQFSAFLNGLNSRSKVEEGFGGVDHKALAFEWLEGISCLRQAKRLAEQANNGLDYSKFISAHESKIQSLNKNCYELVAAFYDTLTS